jgi:hypothetical protein
VGVVPYATAVLGMVTLPKPTVPLVPVRLNDRVVVAADWLDTIAISVIWLLVMFPLMVNSTVAPLSVAAETALVGAGVGEGVGLGLAVGLAVGVAVGAAVGTGVGVAVGVAVGVGEGDGLGDGDGEGEGDGDGDAVGVGVGVAGTASEPIIAQSDVKLPGCGPEPPMVMVAFAIFQSPSTVVELPFCHWIELLVDEADVNHSIVIGCAE